MSIGLNKNFKNRDANEQHIRGQNQMGSIDHHNPLDESDEKEDKKLLTEQQLARRDRDLSNS